MANVIVGAIAVVAPYRAAVAEPVTGLPIARVQLIFAGVCRDWAGTLAIFAVLTEGHVATPALMLLIARECPVAPWREAAIDRVPRTWEGHRTMSFNASDRCEHEQRADAHRGERRRRGQHRRLGAPSKRCKVKRVTPVSACPLIFPSHVPSYLDSTQNDFCILRTKAKQDVHFRRG